MFPNQDASQWVQPAGESVWYAARQEDLALVTQLDANSLRHVTLSWSHQKNFLLKQPIAQSLNLIQFLHSFVREAINNKKSHVSMDTFRTPLSPPPGSTDA